MSYLLALGAARECGAHSLPDSEEPTKCRCEDYYEWVAPDVPGNYDCKPAAPCGTNSWYDSGSRSCVCRTGHEWVDPTASTDNYDCAPVATVQQQSVVGPAASSPAAPSAFERYAPWVGGGLLVGALVLGLARREKGS